MLSSAWWKDPQWLGIGVAVAGIIVSVLIAVFPKLRKKKAVKIDVSQTYFWHNEEPNVVEVDQSKKQSKGRSISLKQVATINNRSSQDVTYKSTERFLIVLRILNIGNEPIQEKNMDARSSLILGMWKYSI
ncbi:MAG TPA: hypothetical protein VJ761_01845 [Ktedonobacteraceae bacterium]|nr:hypothetical protein [Ktedonobacteraceae bacterium]